MSKALIAFDYSELAKDDKGKLMYLAGEIKKASAAHARSGLAIGESVAKAHAILAGDGRDGRFSTWVESECGFSRQTAYNYMWTWGRFNESPSIDKYETAALYLLASPKVPESAVKEAEKLAGKGHNITFEVAKEIKDKHTEAKSKPATSQTKTSVKPLYTSLATSDSVSTNENENAENACPKGGDHERNSDGDCVKCFDPPIEPKPAPKISGGATFDVAEIEAAQAAEEPDLKEKQAPYDTMLNAITQIKKLWNEVTGDERDGVYCVTKKQRVMTLLDELRPPIAQARPMKVCTFCKGKGCQKCSGCGWWPRSVVEGLSR